MVSGLIRTSILLVATAICSMAGAKPVHAAPTPFDAPFNWVVVSVPHESHGGAAATLQAGPTASDATTHENYTPSAEAMELMTWVAGSDDNHDLPYIVVDKAAAEVFVFDSSSQLIAASPALVGITPGDNSTPSVGDRELSAIPLDERTTPAGRFIAKFGPAAGGRDVLWVDYPDAISLHAVITSNKKEHRLERLKSPTPEDNRITHGCINVPADFYAKIVKPLFKDTPGVAYILPETKPLNSVFLGMRGRQNITNTLP